MRRCMLHDKRAVMACATPCAREGCGHDCRLHLSTGTSGRHYPGACYAAGCKCSRYVQATKKSDEPAVGTVIRSPATCFCGAEMPWHLFATTGDTALHICAGGHRWAWHSPTKARYTGTLPVIQPHCQADGDDYCQWKDCPQLRDGEPAKSHRDCPLDRSTEEEA